MNSPSFDFKETSDNKPLISLISKEIQFETPSSIGHYNGKSRTPKMSFLDRTDIKDIYWSDDKRKRMKRLPSMIIFKNGDVIILNENFYENPEYWGRLTSGIPNKFLRNFPIYLFNLDTFPNSLKLKKRSIYIIREDVLTKYPNRPVQGKGIPGRRIIIDTLEIFETFKPYININHVRGKWGF